MTASQSEDLPVAAGPAAREPAPTAPAGAQSAAAGPGATDPGATDPAAAPVPDGQRTPAARGLRRHAALRRVAGVLLLLLAALPALAGLRALWSDRDEPYLPFGDAAILELSVREVGHSAVLLGAYSRFEWYHPGPLLAYLLAVPYRLLDGAHQSLAVGALVVAGISSVGAVWLVRRRAGLVAGIWTLLVLTVSVRLLGADFLRDSWNPYLPVLPLLAGVLLCWTAVRGAAWALPVAVVPMSLAVQAHVGFLPAVGAAGAVTAAGLLVRAVRRLRRRGRTGPPVRRLGRWPVAAAAAAAVSALLWLPSIIEERTQTPGNASLLLDYLREGPSQATLSVGTALRVVADEFARLPVYAVGGEPPRTQLLPGLWPPWAIAVGLVLFVAALVAGALRRRGDVLWLGAFTLAIAAAGVGAVARIDGLPFVYITRWTVVVGILGWVTVGLGLLPELAAGVRRTVGRIAPAVRPGAVLGLPLAALATVAVLATAAGTARAQTPFTDVTGGVARLEAAVVDDLDRLGLTSVRNPPVVRVDFAATTRPVIVGTFWEGTGLVLELARDGVDVQVAEFWRLQFGPRYTDRPDEAGYVVTFAYSDGSSPPPEPWQRILAVEGEFQVYGGVPPTG